MTDLAQRMKAASRRVDTALKNLRTGKGTREQYDARRAELRALCEAVEAEQLTGLAEAHLERDQLAWSEGNIGRRW